MLFTPVTSSRRVNAEQLPFSNLITGTLMPQARQNVLHRLHVVRFQLCQRRLSLADQDADQNVCQGALVGRRVGPQAHLHKRSKQLLAEGFVALAGLFNQLKELRQRDGFSSRLSRPARQTGGWIGGHFVLYLKPDYNCPSCVAQV